MYNIIEQDPSWLLQDASWEKVGALMADNSGRLLGLYDELSSFLTRLNLFRGKGLSDSHELSMFLELYNANEWTRTTGNVIFVFTIFIIDVLVSGEANFSMEKTSLTIGGFNQPYVSRSLIEQPGNVEKGLSQRFLWLFPKPIYTHFENLEELDKDFVETLGKYMRKHCNCGVTNFNYS